jgi:tRNA dimethylallyltransferase
MNLTGNSDGNKQTIPVLVGPTASGKTSTALKILDSFPNTELISADSRQIYKYLNIGTDKPSLEETAKYKMHLVDFVEPGERYTAFDFVSDARKIIFYALDKGIVPLICGGTGLYVRALIEGITEIPDDDFKIRDRLEEEFVEKGPQYLYEKLEKIDPVEASKTHPHNIKRIIRALEIYELTGLSKTDLLAEQVRRMDDWQYRMVCLLPPREKLYQKINLRVDGMIESGLLKEVKDLMNRGLENKIKKINVIGYNELFKYYKNEVSLSEAVNLIKQNSRRYAKRQITWYRGMKNLEFCDTHEGVIKRLEPCWANRGKY